MKNLFNYILTVFLIFHIYSPNVYALEKNSILNKSGLIASKYAARYCSSKENNFFEGLENEKTLKYSYFKYIGFKNKEIYKKDMYKPLINKIGEKCSITREEEEEIYKFFLKESVS